jgi:predicted DNA-binding ribbon-helix-helix protein
MATFAILLVCVTLMRHLLPIKRSLDISLHLRLRGRQMILRLSSTFWISVEDMARERLEDSN